MGGKDFEKHFKGFEMGIKVVNLKAARGLEGEELGVLARDLDERDPHKMESDTFKYAAKNYKLKEEGRNKMSSETKKILDEIVKETEEKRSIEVAKNMLRMNVLTYEQIAEASEISVAEVRNLAMTLT